MNIQKKEVTVNLPALNITTSTIVDSDAIVNDSKPDLLKIIRIDSSARVAKTEVLNGKMMINGHITYKVLYQPENAVGVCSIQTGADFSHMEENPAFSEGIYSDVSACVEHVESDLVNSRKIKIKSVVTLEIKTESAASLYIPLAVEGDNLQVKTGTFSGHSRFLQKRDIITVSDTLSLPAGKPNIGSVLKYDVTLCNKDIKIISGKVIIKGEFEVCALYIPESGEGVDCCRHTLPFTEILDAEGLSDEHRCRVKTEMEDCDFSLATDADGEIRILNANIRMGVRISADVPISENVVTDFYSLTDNLQIERTPMEIQTPVATLEFDHTVTGSIRPSGFASSVYNVTARPALTGAIAADGKVILEGVMDISALCLSSEPSAPVIPHSEEIPFRIEAIAEGVDENTDVSAELEVNSITYNMGSSGEIELRIVLSCGVDILCRNMIEIVESVQSSGVIDCHTPSIVLYFVQQGDTLWDIAKRYHTKTEYIEELNGDECKPLKPGSQILIPRG